MSKIIYKPHCEKCGSVIDQKIQFKRTVCEFGDRIHWLYLPEYYEFNPYQCEVCGAVFDSAELQPPEEVEYF